MILPALGPSIVNTWRDSQDSNKHFILCPLYVLKWNYLLLLQDVKTLPEAIWEVGQLRGLMYCWGISFKGVAFACKSCLDSTSKLVISVETGTSLETELIQHLLLCPRSEEPKAPLVEFPCFIPLCWRAHVPRYNSLKCVPFYGWVCIYTYHNFLIHLSLIGI